VYDWCRTRRPYCTSVVFVYREIVESSNLRASIGENVNEAQLQLYVVATVRRSIELDLFLKFLSGFDVVSNRFIRLRHSKSLPTIERNGPSCTVLMFQIVPYSAMFMAWRTLSNIYSSPGRVSRKGPTNLNWRKIGQSNASVPAVSECFNIAGVMPHT
jgi:hypothetical protein